MHAFRFTLSYGACAEDLGPLLPDSAEALAAAVQRSRMVQHLVATYSPASLRMRYETSSLDVRPDMQSRLVEVGQTSDLASLNEWAAKCWQNVLDDCHQGLGFTCACLKGAK